MSWVIIVSLVVPIIILVLAIALLCLWINYKRLRIRVNDVNAKLEEKTSPYKQAIYLKQIDGCFELTDIMQKIKALISDIYHYYSKGIKDDIISIKLLKMEAKTSEDLINIEKIKKKLRSYKSEYKDKLDKWVIVLPKKLQILFIGFIENINFDHLDLDKIIKAYTHISIVVYQELGVEPPSEELQKMMKKTSKLSK